MSHPLSASNPQYSKVIDDEEYATHDKIMGWRDEQHRKMFPNQYDASGTRVRDIHGDPI